MSWFDFPLPVLLIFRLLLPSIEDNRRESAHTQREERAEAQDTSRKAPPKNIHFFSAMRAWSVVVRGASSLWGKNKPPACEYPTFGVHASRLRLHKEQPKLFSKMPACSRVSPPAHGLHEWLREISEAAGTREQYPSYLFPAGETSLWLATALSKKRDPRTGHHLENDPNFTAAPG